MLTAPPGGKIIFLYFKLSSSNVYHLFSIDKKITNKIASNSKYTHLLVLCKAKPATMIDSPANDDHESDLGGLTSL